MSVLFSWIDYILFILMLSVSALIGIYFGFFKKQTSVQEYLLGGKNMNVWPTSLSLVSSCVSGIPLLAFPTEVYLFGPPMALIVFEVVILMAVTYFIFLPVFYKLQVTSVYEYFQLRFDKKIRILASVLYTIYMGLYLPLVIYVPSLALAQVTGLSTRVLTPIICGICIFYTTLGGLKAVVWTDALQFIFMMGSMMVVVIIGVTYAGGLENVWRTALTNGRLRISFDLDITQRDTFWSGAVGYVFVWINVVSINQGTIQKCMSLSSYKDIKRAITSAGITLTFLLFFVFFTGFAMHAKYFDCDPLISKKISKVEQLLPYYVMDVAENMRGLPGLFIAGILSAALSTLSAGMNCLAATIYEDFVKPFITEAVSEEKISSLLKLMVVVIGIICTGLVYVFEQLGRLVPLVNSVMGVAGGPIIGIFTVGMMMPMVNSIGALIGGVSSLCIMSWTVVGAHLYRADHPYPSLPLSVAGCSKNASFANAVNATQSIVQNDDGFFLYRISHNYYAMMGFLIVVIISVIVSYFTKRKNRTVPRECITPLMHFLLPKTCVYFSVEEAAQMSRRNNF